MFTVFGFYPEGHEDGYCDVATLAEALAKLRYLIAAEIADPDGPVFDRYALSFERADAPAVAKQIHKIAMLKSVLAEEDLELSLPEWCWTSLNQLREAVDSLPDQPGG